MRSQQLTPHVFFHGQTTLDPARFQQDPVVLCTSQGAGPVLNDDLLTLSLEDLR